jgi:hypothetical protein
MDPVLTKADPPPLPLPYGAKLAFAVASPAVPSRHENRRADVKGGMCG